MTNIRDGVYVEDEDLDENYEDAGEDARCYCCECCGCTCGNGYEELICDGCGEELSNWACTCEE